MSIKSAFKKIFNGNPTEGPCPLCNGSEYYVVSGMLRYSQLVAKINKIDSWAKAHLIEPGMLPDISAALKTQIGDPQLPDMEPDPDAQIGSDDRHVRCAKCHSLMPPQFWRKGPARRLALTVAGAPKHGKTTWLLAVLKPPFRSRYSIIGFTDKLVPRHYNFGEPYAVSMLERGLDVLYRSAVPLVLMGTTVRHGSEDVDIRTLDIMGEMFRNEDYHQTVAQSIRQHVTSRRGGGALLVVQRFSKEASERLAATQITASYRDIYLALNDRRKTTILWKGVVWSFLDEAQWSDATAAWLGQFTAHADLFRAIGSSLPTFNGPDTPFAAYRAIRDQGCEPLRSLVEVVQVERNATDLSSEVLEGLIALLFRLQVAYSLDAARHARDRYADYYRDGGFFYVDLCQKLARALYIRWDAELGGMGDIVRPGEDDEMEWRVMPCGRLEEHGQWESVWNDQLLLDTVRWVTSI